jgi:hypothetical protein
MTTDTETAVRTAVAAGADDMVAGLVEWLRIPSISGDPDHHPDVRRSAEHLAQALRDTGFPTVEVWETAGLPTVFAEWPSDDADAPTALVYGHHDVQPVTPLELWKYPPFEIPQAAYEGWPRERADDKGQVWFHTLGVGRTSRRPAAPARGQPQAGRRGRGGVRLSELRRLLREKADRFGDVVVVSDTGMWSRTPTVASACAA